VLGRALIISLRSCLLVVVCVAQRLHGRIAASGHTAQWCFCMQPSSVLAVTLNIMQESDLPSVSSVQPDQGEGSCLAHLGPLPAAHSRHHVLLVWAGRLRQWAHKCAGLLGAVVLGASDAKAQGLLRLKPKASNLLCFMGVPLGYGGQAGPGWCMSHEEAGRIRSHDHIAL
jgi:hypothetical protein